MTRSNWRRIPWSAIPEHERPLYQEAEKAQWDEHVQFGAVKPLSLSESEEVRATVAPDRILGNPELPPKPKARFCVSGQNDPDLGRTDMAVDAPTASRHSVLLAIQLALARLWSSSIGDIRAAFLNGVPASRNLYFEQPRRGIPGLVRGQLVAIVKGVFGLSTSPKLWWLKLSSELLGLQFTVGNLNLFLEQNPIDPCVFMVKAQEDNQVHGLLLTHVDDLLLLGQTELRKALEKELSARFPVDSWTEDRYEYLGCHYAWESEGVRGGPRREGRRPARTARRRASHQGADRREPHGHRQHILAGQADTPRPSVRGVRRTAQTECAYGGGSEGHQQTGRLGQARRQLQAGTPEGAGGQPRLLRLPRRRLGQRPRPRTTCGWVSTSFPPNWPTWFSTRKRSAADPPSLVWSNGGAGPAAECAARLSLARRWLAATAWKPPSTCGACYFRWLGAAPSMRTRQHASWTSTS